MNDKFRIDSHKLMFHPKRVSEWLEARENWELLKKIYPIYVEISPVGYCNHRCRFCARDFMEYQKRQIDPLIMKNTLIEMSKLGVKSVMFAGEGEPLLYKELPEMVELCSEIGIDTSLTTNFSHVSENGLETLVKRCKWIKVSINAGTAENYSFIHQVNEHEFNRVVNNMRTAVELKKKNGYKCTIGAQILLVNDNYDTVLPLAEKMREIGADYLVVKPYSHHHESKTDIYKGVDYSRYLFLNDELKKYNTDSFKTIFRINTINKLINHYEKERYKHCKSVPFFWAYVMSSGDVFGCSTFLTNDKFNFGNVNVNSFQEIWESSKRKECIEYMKTFKVENCRLNCRMDEINNYLWELANPSEHVNFI